jgi:hypothetical protein
MQADEAVLVLEAERPHGNYYVELMSLSLYFLRKRKLDSISDSIVSLSGRLVLSVGSWTKITMCHKSFASAVAQGIIM